MNRTIFSSAVLLLCLQLTACTPKIDPPKTASGTKQPDAAQQSEPTPELVPADPQDSQPDESTNAKSNANPTSESPTADSPPPTLSEMIEVEAGTAPWISVDRLPWNNSFVQFVDGARIGYTQLTVLPPALRGSRQLTIKRVDSVEFTRAGRSARIDVELDALETSDGRMLEFTETTHNGGQEIITKGNLTRGYLQLSTQFGENKKSQKVSIRLGTWGIAGTQAVLMQNPLKPGDRRKARVYVHQLRNVVDVEFTALEPELTAMMDGSKVELLPIDVVQKASPDNGVRSRNWVNELGEIQKTVSFSGMNVSWFRTTPDYIARIHDGNRLNDDDLNRTTPLAGTPKSIDATTKIVYAIYTEGFDPFRTFPSEGKQQVQSATARRGAITVQDIPLSELAKSPAPKSPEQFTSKSPVIETENDAAIKLADQWCGESDNQLAIAQSLAKTMSEKFAYEENLTSEFNTAFEQISKQSGNSLEQASLLATLLRIKSIPSRCVGGLRIDSENQQLVYHAWTEARISDTWIGLDATAGGLTDATYIKVVDSPMTSQNPFAIVLPVLELLPKMHIAISDVE